MNEIVDEIAAHLNANQLEEFEERAGIIEFEAGVQRDLAEALALLCVLRRHPDVLTRCF